MQTTLYLNPQLSVRGFIRVKFHTIIPPIRAKGLTQVLVRRRDQKACNGLRTSKPASKPASDLKRHLPLKLNPLDNPLFHAIFPAPNGNYQF